MNCGQGWPKLHTGREQEKIPPGDLSFKSGTGGGRVVSGGAGMVVVLSSPPSSPPPSPPWPCLGDATTNVAKSAGSLLDSKLGLFK